MQFYLFFTKQHIGVGRCSSVVELMYEVLNLIYYIKKKKKKTAYRKQV